MRILTLDTELAWSAGFLDGEGNFRCGVTHRSNGYTQTFLRIQAQQVHREPLDRLARAIGGRVTGPYGPYATQKYPAYAWTISGYNEAKRAIMSLLPYLSPIKWDQAMKAWGDLLEARAQKAGI